MPATSPTSTPPITNHGTRPFVVDQVRQDFPALHQLVHGKPLVYLDNAATAQTPHSVITAMTEYYVKDRANIHRGVHVLSQRATQSFEQSRERVARYLGGTDTREIVFTRGTTEAINLVAFGLERTLQRGDEILITGLEHHSNIVPWQLLAQRTGAKLTVVPINDAGEVLLEAFVERLNDRTRIAAFSHVSNALGTVNPVQEMVRAAQRVGAITVVDGAQAIPHRRVDVKTLDCDFYAWSGHKLFGPTGVGVLYGRLAHLEAMPPWQGGGDMIRSVTFEETLFAPPPAKFEAGTPDIAAVIGLGAAIDYVEALDLSAASAWEHQLLKYAEQRVSDIPGLRIVGTAAEKEAVLSFVIDDVHPHDIGTIMDMEGIAIRTGHHCAQPVMDRFGIPATARASFAFYNTLEEVDILVKGIERSIDLLR